MGSANKDKEARKLELLKMSIADLRKALIAHPGILTQQEVEKLHALKLIEVILAAEFPG